MYKTTTATGRSPKSAMSKPEKRIRNDKVRWYARYQDPSGKQLSKTFNRQGDAERFLRGIETAKDNNNYLDPARGKITMSVMAGQVVEDRRPPEAIHPR